MAVYKSDPSLQGYWSLDEVSGIRRDYTRNGNHLTDNNTVLYSTDHREGVNSADFEATTLEWLSITDAAQTGLDIIGSLTICMWVNPESFPTNLFLAGKYTTVGNQRAYMLRLTDLGTTGAPVFILSSNGTAISSLTADTAVSAATWYHLAAVYDGTDQRLYLNGGLDCTPLAYSSGIFNSSAPFNLGQHPEGIWYYDGLMDGVAVFSRALSAAEILDVYLNGILDSPRHPAQYNELLVY